MGAGGICARGGSPERTMLLSLPRTKLVVLFLAFMTWGAMGFPGFPGFPGEPDHHVELDDE